MKSRTIVLTGLGLAIVCAFLLTLGAPQALAAGMKSPILVTPANGSLVRTLNPLFHWDLVVPKPPRDGSWIEVWKKDANGHSVDVILWFVPQGRYQYPFPNFEGVGVMQAKLARGTKYFWHVSNCFDPTTCGSWSATWTFTTY